MSAPGAHDAIDLLWKADLHVHLAGTVDHPTMRRLARKHGVAAPSARGYRAAASSSESFFAIYELIESLLQEPEDITSAAAAHLRRARTRGVRWVEMSVGISAEASPQRVRGVVEAVVAGFRDTGMDGGVILTLKRGVTPDVAKSQVEALQPILDKVLAVGIAGPEIEDLADYAEAFETARRWGLRTVAHVGSPRDIAAALETLRVNRIDHGFRVVETPDLVTLAIERDVPFTICPVTNVLIGPVTSIADHPLVLMRGLGLRISLASDDPALLGHDLSDVYRLTQRARHLSDAELASIARESSESAFADDEVKKRAVLEIERWLLHVRRRDPEPDGGR